MIKLERAINRLRSDLAPIRLGKGCHHYAVLLSGTNPISRFYPNQARTYIRKKLFPSLHAEINLCLTEGKHRVRNKNILIVRLNDGGQLRLSKPCLICLRWLIGYGLRKVYYSTDQGLVVQPVDRLTTNHLTKGYR